MQNGSKNNLPRKVFFFKNKIQKGNKDFWFIKNYEFIDWLRDKNLLID